MAKQISRESSVRIKLSQIVGESTVEVNGHNLKRGVRSVCVRQRAGDLPVVELELIPEYIEVTGMGTVMYHFAHIENGVDTKDLRELLQK